MLVFNVYQQFLKLLPIYQHKIVAKNSLKTKITQNPSKVEAHKIPVKKIEIKPRDFHSRE